MRRAFGQAGFGRLYGGLAASMLGDSMMLLVLSIWVKTLTGSNALAGLTFLFMVVPSLFAPLLGVLIDRVRRRPMLVWGNLASALVVLPLVLVHDADDVWIIWLVAFGYGVSFVALPAALNGLLKELMPDELLVEANSAVASRVVRRAGEVTGIIAGLVLFAIAVGGIAAAPAMTVVLVFAAVSGAGLPLMIIGYLTLLQRRTPQAIMGRASTAAEVVLATPQAISLALGSLLVMVLDYRLIFAAVAVVTLLGALHIAFWLREHIAREWRHGATPDPRTGLVAVGSTPPD